MNYRMPLAFSMFLALCGGAQADNYASPPLYAGVEATLNAADIVCRIFNGGDSTVNVTFRKIIANSNASMKLHSDSCKTALGANKYCAFDYIANAGDNLAYTCRLTTSQSATQLHGVIEFMDYNSGAIVSTLPMSQ